MTTWTRLKCCIGVRKSDQWFTPLHDLYNVAKGGAMVAEADLVGFVMWPEGRIWGMR